MRVLLNLMTAAPGPISKSSAELLNILVCSSEDTALQIAEIGGSAFLAEMVKRKEVQEDQELLLTVLRTISKMSDIGNASRKLTLKSSDAMIDDVLEKESMGVFINLLNHSDNNIVDAASLCLYECFKREQDGEKQCFRLDAFQSSTRTSFWKLEA